MRRTGPVVTSTACPATLTLPCGQATAGNSAGKSAGWDACEQPSTGEDRDVRPQLARPVAQAAAGSEPVGTPTHPGAPDAPADAIDTDTARRSR